MTLLEYCYYHHHIRILDFAYNTQLKNMYKNEEYMENCGNGNFRGLFTCIKNGIDLEQRDKSDRDFTGLIWASREGHKSIVDILIDF